MKLVSLQLGFAALLLRSSVPPCFRSAFGSFYSRIYAYTWQPQLLANFDYPVTAAVLKHYKTTAQGGRKRLIAIPTTDYWATTDTIQDYTTRTPHHSYTTPLIYRNIISLHFNQHTMSDEHDNHSAGHAGRAYPIERSDSSASTTPSDQNESVIHQPIPTRPGPRDSSQYEPEIIRPMSPRRTNEDINKMGEEAREELRK